MFKKEKSLAGTIKIISYLLILLPVALGFLYVYSFGVNVIDRDSWAMVDLFRKLHSGTLGASDLWAQHAEHRILFPRIAMLSLGTLTDFNSVAEMYLIQSCFLVTLIALLLVFKSNVKRDLLFFLPIPFLVFSFGQFENMQSGFQITFAFAQVFSVLALYFLYVSGRGGRAKSKRLAFPTALVSGMVAAFSTAQGLFVWPVGLLQLLISPVEKPAKKRLVGAWSLAGVGVWTIYFLGYTKPDQMPSLRYVFDDPGAGIDYFLTLLGSSLFGGFGQPGTAFAGGSLLVGLIVVSLLLIYKDRRLGENSFWIALLLFSFFVLVSITLGRAGFGAFQATQSKYTSFSVLAVVGLYAILVKTTSYKRSYLATAALVLLSVLMVLSVPVSYAQGVSAGVRTKVERERAAFTLSTYKSQPGEFLTEIHGPHAVKQTAPILEGLGYNVFSKPLSRILPPPLSELSPIPSSTLSEVESISGVEVDQEDQPIPIPADEPFVEVSGWAVDAGAEDVAGGVYVDVDGKLFPAFYGKDRQDIAGSFGVPAYRYSGFERAIRVPEIGTGTHELSVIVLTDDKEGYYRPAQEVAFEIR